VVPSEILSKPAKLTSAEMDNVRRHPDEGARIIGPLAAWLGEWADAVPHHHERFDGRGYPRGLAGDQISLAGRIVAVADSYEVMTAVRPYRKPIGVTAARQELVKCSGAQFDPVVVRAFLNISVGRLWRVVGIGSWIAQLPVIGWVDRLGWNWGAAIMSGTTAIGLTAPGLVPRPAPLPTPTSGISVVSTGSLPGQTGGSGTAAVGSGLTTGGAPGQTTSTTPAPASDRGSGPTSQPGLDPIATPAPGGPMPSTPPIATPTATPTPIPSSTPTPTLTPTPIPTPTPPPDQAPKVIVNGGVALLGNFSASGNFTDADFPGNAFTATVNYGDGTGTHSLPLVGMTFTLSHRYTALIASYRITVTVTETGGLSGTGNATVTVALGL
jgi:hypothetical protein